MLDHSGRDKSSHILKDQIEKEHPCPQYDNLKIISSGFRNNIKKRKLSEVLWTFLKQAGEVYTSKAFYLMFFLPFYCLITFRS